MVISKRTIRILIAILFLGFMAAGYLVYHQYSRFNRMVLERFQGRLWELPAKIYAMPMALYPEMRLNASTFERALNRMGYQKAGDPARLESPGHFFRKGGLFVLSTRSFEFEKERHSSGKIQVKIRGGRVSAVSDVQHNKALEMVRLSPALIGSFYPRNNEDRVLLTLNQTPPQLTKTLLTVEDRTFYAHHGIEPLAILRALWINVRKGHISQGASTITQQLAKNFFLTPRKSLKRKLDEMFVAVAMEKNFSKDEILETYLNEVYLGQDGKRAIHGFGLASAFYFGKDVGELNIQEIALLVGMLKGPSHYNPRKYPERALSRRNTVLDILRDQQVLSPDRVEQAQAAPLSVIPKAQTVNSPFPAYLQLVKRQLLREYRESDLRSAGLRIFTTLDLQVQLAAEGAVERGLETIETDRGLPAGKLEAAVVVTATGSNEVLALLGSRDARDKGFNRGMDARRAIGSLMKPAVYLTALKDPGHYTLITPLEDRPISVPLPDGSIWRPKNYDRRYHGTIPLYQALVHSYNASTVRLGLDLGLPAVYDTLKKMGFQRKIPMYPASLLGAVEMSPLEVAQIYQTLSSGGFYSPVRAIHAIYQSDGSILQRYPLSVTQNLKAGPVYLLNRTLQTVVTQGSAASLETLVPRSWRTAGKTGTTNDLRDSWFAGFTGSRLAVVWVGRDDNKPCGLSGASGALRVWGRFMAELPNAPLILTSPEDVMTVPVNVNTGFRAPKGSPNAMAVPFIKGSEPPESASKSGENENGNHALDKKGENSESGFIHWLKDLFK